MLNQEYLDIASQLASIRAALRTRMDGSVAQSMRESGLDYRFNWGWTRGYLVELAEQYTPSRQLSQALRETSVRELLILSTMLFPKEDLTEQDIEDFLAVASNGELREQLAFNLLSHCHIAICWALQIVSSKKASEETLYVALLTLANYTKRQSHNPFATDLVDILEEYVVTDELSISCRRVAYDLLIALEDRSLT